MSRADRRHGRLYCAGPVEGESTMIPIPTIETERLRLCSYSPEDFGSYAAMWSDPAVVRFIGGQPFSREQAWIRFLRQFGMWQVMGFGFFALRDRTTGAFLGEAGFHELRRDITPSLEGTLEVGWALVGAAQGRGLAEEAVRATLGWADKAMPALQQTCIIDELNAASIRVAEKVGFRNLTRTGYHGTPVVVLRREPESWS